MLQYNSNNSRSILEKELVKGERLPVGWPWRLLTFMAIIFLTVFLIYAGIAFGYSTYLKSQIKDLDEKIAEFNKSIDKESQEKLIAFYSQFVNVKKLLESHVNGSKIFEFLQKNTHQKVYYANMNLSLKEKNIRLDGVAPDYNILAQQMEIFRRAPEIENVSLTGSQAKDNDIAFSLSIILKPELFKF
ncbi:PilN domain-containing protein [Candidatus Wolfebacteria bacterium]|nr:PilN domain-containing protein [Candidatus Wolfebacteria bacterium]